MVKSGEEVNEIRLDFVRVLVLVDEDVLKLLLIKFADVLFFLQQSQRINQKVVVVHDVVSLLAVAEDAVDRLELANNRVEVGIIVNHHGRDRVLRVGRKTEDVAGNGALGQFLVLRV